ncbi:MAG: ABC transporter permease subunit, partial [Cumulibacter sp.]
AEFARLNGVRGLNYALRIATNAAVPVIHAFTVMIAGLIGGAIVVETLFNVSGIGHELTRAVQNRDVPLVQGASLALGSVILALLLVGDVVARLWQARTSGEIGR